MNAGSPSGPLVQRFYEERLMRIFGDLSIWRIDTFVRQMEVQRQKRRILSFARGLRLSAHLIYVVREILEGSNLTANWGHLIDESGTVCSPECDVIIHRKGHIHIWNGTKQPIMDFRFVDQRNAVAVISCKSYLRSGHIDKDYCESMEPFVSKIWLFAECCGPRSVETIRGIALESGYEHFWYLYVWSKQTETKPNKEGWNKFLEEVKKLAE